MRTVRALLAGLLLLGLLCATQALAAPPPGASVTFAATSPEGDGVFQLRLSVASATFNAFQFAVRFDPAVLQPVDAAGKPTADFGAFAHVEPAWLSTIGCSVVPSTGFFGFTGYLAPGASGPGIVDGEVALEATALPLFTFRFRRLTQGDPALKIATQALGAPYELSFPEGAGLLGRAGAVTGSIRFDLTALTQGTVTAPLEPPAGSGGTPAPSAPLPTAETLLPRLLILQLGSHAAVASGGVVAFYPGERSVVPYADAHSRTLVPLRFLAERLGATVTWENSTRTASICLGSKTIAMTIGSSSYTVDGALHTMDTAPTLSPTGNGTARTMVPVRFVAQALGYTVTWDAAHQLVVLAPGDYPWGQYPQAEAAALSEASKLLLLYRNFV